MDIGNVIAVIFVGLAIIAVFVAVERRGLKIKKQQEERMRGPIATVGPQTSLIQEDVKTTPTGHVCAFFLAVAILISIVIFAASQTVFGQIEAGIVLIASGLLFGMGIVLGRERSFRVYPINQVQQDKGG